MESKKQVQIRIIHTYFVAKEINNNSLCEIYLLSFDCCYE